MHPRLALISQFCHLCYLIARIIGVSNFIQIKQPSLLLGFPIQSNIKNRNLETIFEFILVRIERKRKLNVKEASDRGTGRSVASVTFLECSHVN